MKNGKTDLTFKPLSRNRYRCNQTGQILTKSEILSYVLQCFNIGVTTRIKSAPNVSSQKPNRSNTHASKYRQKHS
jgi:hypothetical protein